MSDRTVVELDLRPTYESGQRQLDGVCVRYDVAAWQPDRGRPERFIAGAFARASPLPGKVRLLSGVGEERAAVAVAVKLRENTDGLAATFRLYDTPAADAVWRGLEAGAYGGLAIGYHAVKVRRQSVRDGAFEVLSARLHYLALVPQHALTGA